MTQQEPMTEQSEFTALTASAIAHMNADHAHNLRDYARVLAGLPWAAHAQMIALDRAGFTLRAEGDGRSAVTRIAFETPWSDGASLRRTVVALAEQARSSAAPAGLSAALPDAPASLTPLTEVIRRRRSVGVFRDEPVPLALITELLDTAVYAPNHRMTEPWRFIVVQGAARERLAAVRRTIAHDAGKGATAEQRATYAEQVYQNHLRVPAFVFVLQCQADDLLIREEDYAACCCLVQNLLLLACERGLGTCWKTPPADERLATFLGMQADERIAGLIWLGYPAVLPHERPRAFAQARLSVLDADESAA